MGKYSLTKRRHSHQSKILHTQQDETFMLKKIDHANSTLRLKHRASNTFRPLAASTPYDIEQSNSFNDGSPRKFNAHVARLVIIHPSSLLLDSMLRQQRFVFTPPVFSSTPKQTRRQATNTITSHARSTSSSLKPNCFLDLPGPMPAISQRRLQFTPTSQSFVRYANDDSKRLNIQNIKIWLL